jgi:transmembrane sensor
VKDTQEYLKYLLARKTLTSEEKEWLLNYLERTDVSDFEKVAAADFEADIAYMRKSLGKSQSESLLKNIHTRIEIPQRSLARVIRLHRLKVAIAAAIIVLAGAGYWLKENMAMTGRVQKEVVTTGKRKVIKLADGSVITVEPNSRLSYPNRFSGNTREVQLTGEAFFEVKHDEKHPFVIHSPSIKTTVLGTAFNIEDYANGFSRVVVTRGSVKVETIVTEKDLQAVIINGDQSVVYNKTTNEIQKIETPDDAAYYRQRHTGRFSYAGVSVAKVIEEMERYYHTKITLEGNAKGCAFYGYFHVDDPVDKALSLVALALNATVKKDNNKGYIISGGNCR